MRLEQLTYFVEAVNRGSINKAAEALYVSQSTVHDALKKLDEELGAVLLNRTHIGVVGRSRQAILQCRGGYAGEYGRCAPRHSL